MHEFTRGAIVRKKSCGKAPHCTAPHCTAQYCLLSRILATYPSRHSLRSDGHNLLGHLIDARNDLILLTGDVVKEKLISL